MAPGRVRPIPTWGGRSALPRLAQLAWTHRMRMLMPPAAVALRRRRGPFTEGQAW